jgi:phasin family protein
VQHNRLDKPIGAPHIDHVALQQGRRDGLRSNLNDDEVLIMATKTKTAGEKIGGTESIETAIKTGSAAFKTGFDKAVKNYDQFLGYGKDTVEAYMKSANATGKGVETLHNELYAFSKQSVEDSIAATKALLGTKSVHEAFELQSDFAKSAFDSYVSQVTKLGEIFSATAKEAIEPLQGRVQAWVEVVQSSRAA